jgi:hypothetical protein
MAQTTKAITIIAAAKTIRKVLVSSAMGPPFSAPVQCAYSGYAPRQLTNCELGNGRAVKARSFAPITRSGHRIQRHVQLISRARSERVTSTCAPRPPAQIDIADFPAEHPNRGVQRNRSPGQQGCIEHIRRNAARMLFSESVSADLRLNQPIVRAMVCCACAESGIASAPVRPAKNSRRLMFAPGSGANIVLVEASALIGSEAAFAAVT